MNCLTSHTRSTVATNTAVTSRIRLTIRTSAVLLSLATLAACGGSDATSPVAPALTVNATPERTFTPATLTVDVGATVTFNFGSLQHNVFFDAQANAPANIGGNNVNTIVTRVFQAPGTYRYTCHIHPSMAGSIIVRATAS